MAKRKREIKRPGLVYEGTEGNEFLIGTQPVQPGTIVGPDHPFFRSFACRGDCEVIDLDRLGKDEEEGLLLGKSVQPDYEARRERHEKKAQQVALRDELEYRKLQKEIEDMSAEKAPEATEESDGAA